MASVRGHWSVLRIKLQWLLDSADLIDRPEQARRLQLRLLSVNEEFGRLEDAYQGILEHIDTTVPSEKEIMNAARLEYARALEAFDKLLIIKSESSPSSPMPTTSGNKSDATRTDSDALLSRLPTLQLPLFSGAMDQWVGFNNLFDSLVDSRSDLSASQKLAYLMSCLTGEARGLVQHIKITDEGYKTARDLLVKRYQNTRRLADVHVDQILKLTIISPRLSGLRCNFLNPLIMAVNSLERLGFPVSQWSFLLLHICLTKLPTNLKSRFEQKCGNESDVIPTFSDLIDFLEMECRLIECTQGEPSSGVQCDSSVGFSKHGRKPAQFMAATVTQPCVYCDNNNHSALTSCSEFKGLTPYARKDFVVRNRLCFFCLGTHEYRNCRRVPKCSCGSEKHHPMLCFNRSGTVHPQHHSNNNTSDRAYSRTGGDMRRSATGGDTHRPNVSQAVPTRSSPSNQHRSDNQHTNDEEEHGNYRYYDNHARDKRDKYNAPRIQYLRERQ